MPIQLTPDTHPSKDSPHTETAEMPPVKRCKTCGEEKSVTEYAGCGVTADKLQPNCRPCHSARMSAGHAKKHSRRATASAAPVPTPATSIETPPPAGNLRIDNRIVSMSGDRSGWRIRVELDCSLAEESQADRETFMVSGGKLLALIHNLITESIG